MKALAWLAGVFVYAAVVVVSFLIGLEFAYVESIIWSWFAVPRGLPAVSVVEFFGLSCLVGLFKMKTPRAELKDDRKLSEKALAWVGYVMAPWIILGMAWFALR